MKGWWLAVLAVLAGVAAFVVLLWLPARRAEARSAVFVIPRGTAEQIDAGEPVTVLPSVIRLALDEKDTLVIRNDDVAPVSIASMPIAPGQSFVQRFDEAGTYDYTCSVHPDGGLQVVVEETVVGGADHLHGIEVLGAWTRPAQELGITAVYMTIRNTAHQADRLLGVRAMVSDDVSIHETVHEGDIARMVPLDDLAIPADAEVRMRPGGRHLMLSGLQEPLVEGARVPIILSFEQYGDVEVPLTVSRTEPPAAERPTPADDLPPADATIEIMAPEDGATLDAGQVEVTVAIEGLPDPAVHWHLYVDGTLAGMAVGPRRTALVSLAPGDHELRATLAGTYSHAETSASPKDLIRVHAR